jgi:hypothetical protein
MLPPQALPVGQAWQGASEHTPILHLLECRQLVLEALADGVLPSLALTLLVRKLPGAPLGLAWRALPLVVPALPPQMAWEVMSAA